MGANIGPAVQWMVHQAIHCGIHEAGHKLAHKWASHSNPSNPYQEIEDMILGADEVSIGFSDWSEDALDLQTTCRFFGIPNGNLQFGGFVGVKKIPCDTLDKQKVVVHLYKWCRARAPGSRNSQRGFRFKKGKYVGEGRFISTTTAMVGAGVAAFLGAVLFS